MSKFSDTAAAQVDTRQADEKPLNASQLLGEQFTIWGVQMGNKDGRDWALMTISGTGEIFIKNFSREGQPVFGTIKVWCSPHMILQAREWTEKNYPVTDVILEMNDRGGYEFSAAREGVQGETADTSF